MTKLLRMFVLTALLALCGCGTMTPSLQEFWGNDDDLATRKVFLLHQVQCEIGVALVKELRFKKPLYENLGFLQKWAADVLLQLTIEEKTVAAPSVGINTLLPNASYAIGSMAPISVAQSFTDVLGVGGSTDGYRQEKVHIPYDIPDLMEPYMAYSADQLEHEGCIPKQPSPGFVIDLRDLKIGEWIKTDFKIEYDRQADLANIGKDFADKGVLSNDIKFEIVSSGSINPTWKLLRTNGNTGSNPFISASRDRTQELIITLGPKGSRFERTISNNELAGAINSSINK